MPSQAFYRWEDSGGRVHIVSSLEEVPAPQRAKATRVEVGRTDVAPPRPSAAERSPPLSVDWPSFGIGFGAALLFAMLLRLLPNSWRWLWRLAVFVGIGLLLGGLYLGAVRRAAGLQGAPFAAPSVLLDDAKAAVERMNQRQREQEQELRKIQAEGR